MLLVQYSPRVSLPLQTWSANRTGLFLLLLLEGRRQGVLRDPRGDALQRGHLSVAGDGAIFHGRVFWSLRKYENGDRGGLRHAPWSNNGAKGRDRHRPWYSWEKTSMEDSQEGAVMMREGAVQPSVQERQTVALQYGWEPRS